jgi:hypothetical protein
LLDFGKVVFDQMAPSVHADIVKVRSFVTSFRKDHNQGAALGKLGAGRLPSKVLSVIKASIAMPSSKPSTQMPSWPGQCCRHHLDVALVAVRMRLKEDIRR